MQKRNKALVAAAAAVALGAGAFAGTYSLWVASSEDVQAQTTITAGNLNVQGTASNSWQDISSFVASARVNKANNKLVVEGQEIKDVTISSYRMTPGDSVGTVSKIDTTLSGDNLLAYLTTTGGFIADADGKISISYKVFDADGKALPDVTVGADGALKVLLKGADFTGNGPDVTKGTAAKVASATGKYNTLYVAQIVTFDRQTGGTTSANATVTVSPFSATLTQVRDPEITTPTN